MLHPCTVRRTLALFDVTGDVAKRDYPSSHGSQVCKLTDVDKLLILEMVLDKPGVYLKGNSVSPYGGNRNTSFWASPGKRW